jgi:hypothetical protein
VLQEDDQDPHVVLEDGPAHMVAESPNAPFCTVDATAYRKKQIAKARDKVRVCAHEDRGRRLLGPPAQRHRQGAERDRAPPYFGLRCFSG